MKSSFGLVAIAISTIQIVAFQTITVAKPVSNLDRIVTEVSVRVVFPDSGLSGREDKVGTIVKKDRDLYTVLLSPGRLRYSLDTETAQEDRYITTFDGQKYPIVAIENHDSNLIRSPNFFYYNTEVYFIVKFRSLKDYRVVTIGNAKVLGKKDEIYVSSRRSDKIFIEQNQIFLNNSGQLFYDDRRNTLQNNNELIFNDRGELIGFHRSDRSAIDDERLWPDFQDYPYPTLASLRNLYYGSTPSSDYCGNYGRGIRARAVAIRNRYHRGETTENLSLVAKKIGLKVNIQHNIHPPSIKSEDDFAEALNIRATFYNNYTDEGIAILDRAIASNPLNADLYGMRGNVRLDLNYRKEKRDITVDRKMLTDYDRAIGLNPQDRLSLFLRSNLKTETKDYRGALADLDRLAALQPNSSVVHYYRGYLKQHYLKDFSGALSDYDRLVELNPQDARAYLTRGLLQEQDIRNFQAALVDYSRVLEIVRTTKTDYPSSEIAETAPIYYFIARLKSEKMQDFQGALADYNRILSAKNDDSGSNAEVYLRRAEVRAKLKDVKGAMADYNASGVDRSSNGYLNRAEFKLKYIKDRSGALADYNRAVKVDPTNPKAYYKRGLFRNTYRNNDAAKADFRKAIALLNKLKDRSEDDAELLKKIKSALGN
jgi:tetratricopeptide (TPR) repeat protein